MAFCRKCGSELREECKFCYKCGTPNQEIEAFNAQHSSSNSLQEHHNSNTGFQQQQFSNTYPKKQDSSGWHKAITFCALLVFISGSLITLTLLKSPPKRTAREISLSDTPKDNAIPHTPETFAQFKNHANYPKTWDPLVVCKSIMSLEATSLPSGGDVNTDHYAIGELVSMELEDNSTMSITWVDRASNLASFITFRVPYNSKERSAISDLVLNQTGIMVDYDLLYSVPTGSKKFVNLGEYDLVYRNHADKGPAIMIVRNYRGNR